ncbi:hypothetical protein ABTX35_18960 [Streptomyces sp. NPDC096080]|uniref:hypothetical protein n=1 Tax=Streptomyces sp. NPDC096080 TaxID=3156693 RepID=UPI00331CE1D4
MSTTITLHCNRSWADGACPVRLYTDAPSITEARGIGRGLGWRTHPSGQDFCPGHSGTPPTPASNVFYLTQAAGPAQYQGAPEGPTPLETCDTAARELRTLAAATSHEIATNPYWHSENAERGLWFTNGVGNAVSGLPGVLAGLLDPVAARLLAQILGSHRNTQKPIPAEVFLLARAIQRNRAR